MTAVLPVCLILKRVLTEKLLPTVTKPVQIIGCEMLAVLIDFVQVKFSDIMEPVTEDICSVSTLCCTL